MFTKVVCFIGVACMGILLYLTLSTKKENTRLLNWIKTDPARAKRWAKDNPQESESAEANANVQADLNEVEKLNLEVDAKSN